LEYQHKTILNADEIKRAYLQNLRIEKSSSSITPKQYYFQPKPSTQKPQQPQIQPQTTSSTIHKPQTPVAPTTPTQTQTRT
jgi:hypothetical protein